MRSSYTVRVAKYTGGGSHGSGATQVFGLTGLSSPVTHALTKGPDPDLGLFCCKISFKKPLSGNLRGTREMEETVLPHGGDGEWNGDTLLLSWI